MSNVPTKRISQQCQPATMMNSTADDDGDFPPNPFRSASQQQQPQQQQDFFSSAPAPAFAVTPVTNTLPPPVRQQQPTAFAPAVNQSYTTTASQPTTYTTTVPSGQMNTNASTMSLPQQQTRWQVCMSCFRMETYMAYYDIDTSDIINRIKCSMIYFYQPDKFRSEVIGICRSDNLKGPDLYGPLWITMTLVFIVAVTSNLSDYIRADDVAEFEYDITHLVRATTVCFGFAFGVPALWWVVTQCMGMQALMMVDWICLYGYGMVPYLPATVLCLVPWHFWMWICLTVATCMSALLVVRNVASALLSSDTTSNKAGPLLLAVLASHVIFLLVLKIAFYH